MAISHDFVQGPPDSTGKKIDNAIVGGDKERQVVSVGGPDSADLDAIGVVVNAAPGASVYAPAVRIGDGHDVALGALSDAAVTGDTAGSASAKLRGLSKILADVWDSVNHWLKVQIQGTVTVSGTVTTTPPANASTNLAQVSGANVSLGQKAMAASIPVVLASDETTLPISAASLPLPAGAATETKIGRAH